jgi:CrcB protein
MAISLAALSFGTHLGHLLAPFIPSIPPPPKVLRYSLTIVSILTYAATFVTYFRLPHSFRSQATAALLFSFPGTLTRYLLSVSLNPLSKSMPVGTFAANTFGTALLAMFHVLKGLPRPVSPVACDILQGLGDGYCGCLTTVSTFAAEVSALTVRRRWIYATVTIVTGQLLVLIILGPSFWAGNIVDSSTGSCSTE